jgi:hypothetical protein
MDPLAGGTENRFEFSASFSGMSFSAAGDRAFVFEAWSKFLKHAQPAVSNNQDVGASNVALLSEGARRAEPLSIFLDRAGKTDSNPKIAAAIVLWARRARGKEEIGPNEVKEFWRVTRYKVPGNVPRELARASQRGWLDKAGEGKYRITGHGERFIAG